MSDALELNVDRAIAKWLIRAERALDRGDTDRAQEHLDAVVEFHRLAGVPNRSERYRALAARLAGQQEECQ